VGIFDLPAPSATTPAAWFRQLSQRFDQPINLVAVGDSQMEGGYATTPARRWIRQITPRMVSQLGMTDWGVWMPVRSATSTTYFANITGGAPGQASVDYAGIPGASWWGSQSATWTLPAGTKRFTVYLELDTWNGVATLTPAAGTAVTSPATPPATTVYALTVTNPGASATFTWSGGGGLVLGAAAYSNTDPAAPALNIYGFGQGGATSRDWALNVSRGPWQRLMAMLNPSLALIELGTNDVLKTGDAVGLAEFVSNLELVRAGIKSKPTALLRMAEPSWYRPDAGAGGDPGRWAAYMSRLSQVDGFVVDGARVSTGAPFTGEDNLHLADAGHIALADVIVRALTA
jgi:hypothetical protein